MASDLTLLFAALGDAAFPGHHPAAIAASAGYNTAVRHAPVAVVRARNAQDVVTAVRFAKEHHLRVAVHATGHGTFAPVTDGLLITTALLDHLTIDPHTHIATIGAGVRWDAVIAAAAEHHLAPVAGSSGTVGVVGYLLGGGLGPLARSHGFSSDYLVGCTVVTGGGELLEVDAAHHAELFWALRGGKHGLGIVVAVRLRLIALRSLYAGSLWFTAPHIASVLAQWIRWTHTAAAQVTTSVAIIRFPALDQLPEPLRGQQVLHLRFAYPGSTQDGQRLAAPLRAFAPVHLDDLGPMPAADITRIHQDPREPGPQWVRGQLLRPIDQAFADTVLAELLSERSAAFAMELRHLGAATHTEVAEGSAVGGRPAAYAVAFIATDGSGDAATLQPHSDRLLDVVAPWAAPETNINFTPVARSAAHLASAWSPAIRARLAVLRQQYDPQAMFA
jgi:FAD/FMN-containing dehydrogenase